MSNLDTETAGTASQHAHGQYTVEAIYVEFVGLKFVNQSKGVLDPITC